MKLYLAYASFCICPGGHALIIEQAGSYLGKPFSESNTTPDGRAPCPILSSMLTAFSVAQDVARRLVPSAKGQKADGRPETGGGRSPEVRNRASVSEVRGAQQEAETKSGDKT